MPANSILIVDDEETIRLGFRTALESDETEIVEAPNGLHALHSLETRKFSLILLDLKMPNMDGLEFLARLRRKGDNTPVILITAYGTVPNVVQAMKLGAIDVLEKPVKPNALREAVSEVLKRHSPLFLEKQNLSVEAKIQFAKKLINERRFMEAKNKLYEMFQCTNPELHNLLGMLAEAEGDLVQARARYAAALVFDEHYAPAIENRNRLQSLGIENPKKDDGDRGIYDLMFS